MEDKIKKIVEDTLEALGVVPIVNETVEGRRFATDTFTTVLAGAVGTNIEAWATTHKQFIDTKWDIIKAGLFVPTNDYATKIHEKLLLCIDKPEVDIVYIEVIDGVEVVVYTDDIEAKIEEGLRFRGELE